MRKRVMSLLLAFVMVVGLTPTAAFAAEAPTGVTVDSSSVSRYIFANGNPITLKAGSEAGKTLVYLDSDLENPVDLQISNGDTTRGWDLSSYRIFGGSDANSAPVTVENTSVTMVSGKVERIFGGGIGSNFTPANTSVVSGTAVVKIQGGEVGYVYGGGWSNSSVNNAEVSITGGSITEIASPSGCTNSYMKGTASLTMSDGTVAYISGDNTYSSPIYQAQSASVTVTGGAVSRINGTENESKQPSLTISGDARIGKEDSTNHLYSSISYHNFSSVTVGNFTGSAKFYVKDPSKNVIGTFDSAVSAAGRKAILDRLTIAGTGVYGKVLNIEGDNIVIGDPAPVQTHVHAVSVGCDTDSGEQITFTRLWMDGNSLKAGDVTLSDDDGYELTEGNYYLDENLSLKKRIKVTGTVNLCLNGRQMTLGDNIYVFVFTDNTLNVCDCYDGVTHTETEYHHTYVSPIDETEKAVYGGLITGGNKKDGTFGGAFYINGGNLNMYGGTIAGNKSNTRGGGVYLYGEMNMYGGVICDNDAQTGGGIYASGSTLNIFPKRASAKGVPAQIGVPERGNRAEMGGGVYIDGGAVNMTGGSVTNNLATQYGGGVCLRGGYYGGAEFSVSGEVLVNSNTAKGKPNNLYLPEDAVVTAENLSQYSWIYVTTETAPAANAPVNITGPCGGDFSKAFYSDSEAYIIQNGADNVVQLAVEGAPASAHAHAVSVDCETDTETQTSFTALTAGGGALAAGSYYLTDNAQLSSTLTIASGDTVNLCLNGHSLSYTDGRAISVDGGVLNVCDCSDSSAGVLAGVEVKNDGAFNLYKGAITISETANSAKFGYRGGVNVISGTFHMYGGSITGNKHLGLGYGGGVSVENGGTFIMEGGSITDNKCSDYGGGVYVQNGGSFTMKSGCVISGNSCPGDSGNGGGVYIRAGGSFTMEGGEISQNTAFGGGGVYVYGTFNMENGTISENRGARGGGVYLADGGVFNMSGGSIVDNDASNRGGGVYVQYFVASYDGSEHTGVLNLSGDVTISGSKDANAVATGFSNVYLPKGATLNIVGALSENSEVHALLERPYAQSEDELNVAVGGNGYTVTESDAARFKTDNTDKYYMYLQAEDGPKVVEGLAPPAPAHSHPVCGAAHAPHEGRDETHEDVSWEPFPANPKKLSGNYYLTEDLTLPLEDGGSGEGWVISGNVNLCLNGHTLTSPTRINVNRGVLSICDCSETESGKVQGVQSAQRALITIYDSASVFLLYGGTLTGNATASGMAGGVQLNSGSFYMYGGAITGNSGAAGGVQMQGGKFYLYGGSITGNTARNRGGGVDLFSGTFTVSGGPVIQDNQADGNENNVSLYENKNMVLAGTLTGGAKIGVTTTVQPSKSVFLVIAKPGAGYVITDGDKDKFTSDRSGFDITFDETGQLVLGVAAPPEHEHVWAEEWSSDDDYHWHECTADGCDISDNADKDGYGPHNFNPEKGDTCDTCGHLKDGGDTPTPPEHKHVWAEEWTSDDDHHWHECTSDGCDITDNAEKDGYGPHNFNPENGETCDTCGHLKDGGDTPTPPEHEHVWAEEWTSDGDYHWHECAADDCDISDNADKDGYGTHDFDLEDGETCGTCGYRKDGGDTPTPPEHKHVWAEEWTSDDDHHWHECTADDCDISDNADKDGYGTHDFNSEDGETCGTCGYRKDGGDTPPEHKHVWAEEWTSDDDHHWHECAADDCDVTDDADKDGYGTHDFNSEDGERCGTCGYRKDGGDTPTPPEHKHVWAEKWTSDDAHHWHECTADGCDITDNADKDGYGPHNFNLEDGETCGICGYREERGDTPAPPVPPEPTYEISGTVTEDDKSVTGAEVKLMKGLERIGKSVMTSADGKYTFTGVTPGDYNVVATKDGKTMTILVTVTSADRTDQNLAMPADNVNSVLKVENTPVPAGSAAEVTKAVVDGLDKEADAVKLANPNATSVTVTMTVAAKTEKGATNEEKTEIAGIKAAAPGKKLELLAITVKKEVDDGSPEAITQTENLFTIIIPFEKGARKNIMVYRYHDGSAAAMTEDPGMGNEGFTVGEKNITIYAKKFSTYAIGYTTPDDGNGAGNNGGSGGGGSGGGGSSGPATYPLNTPSGTPNGSVKLSHRNASKGTAVTITATPDPGYEVGQVTAFDKNGKELAVTAKGDNKYEFIMPEGKVTVNVSFTMIGEDGYANCNRREACPIWPYTDANADAWYHDGVHYCMENGLMNGYGNGLFKPNGNLSRAQFAQILYNKENRPLASGGGFVDAPPDAWYANAVVWAAAQGIVSGYGDGRFGPDENITREQLAVMLWRYAGSPAATGDALPFADAGKVSGYALDGLIWAVENDIISGYGDGRLAPQGLATRAEAAKMLKSFFDN